MAINAKSLGFKEQASAPSNPTLGNRKVYFKTDGKMYQRDSSGTEAEIGSGSGSGGVIDITYADLVTAIGANGLISGSLYRITDFATRHYIVDGDGNRYSGTGNEITGVNEPLIVLATGVDTISHEAKSALYPQDIIHYDWNPANWMDDLSFADAESEPATAIITSFKGVIYFRHDTLLDNYVGYDFRNVKFRRWETASGNEIYTSLADTTFASIDYLTFNPTVTSYEDTCKGNHIEGYKSGYSVWDANGTLLGNNVFHLDNDINLTGNNIINSACYNNTIGAGFHSNIIGADFSRNTIGAGFRRNTVASYFYNNTIGAGFHSNTIDTDFYGNTIGDNFYNNTIGAGFSDNIIGDNFHNNIIGTGFYNNTVGTGSYCNTIGSGLYGNTISNDFKFNKVFDGLNDFVGEIDFTSATHVYEEYSCELFINANSQARLSYYNASDVLTVVAANA